MLKLGWMRSVLDLRQFIFVHLLPQGPVEPWESDEKACRLLLYQVCTNFTIQEIDHSVLGHIYKVTTILEDGYWSFATSSTFSLAACIALCRAVNMRIALEEIEIAYHR